jgi:hypothetical protein
MSVYNEKIKKMPIDQDRIDRVKRFIDEDPGQYGRHSQHLPPRKD